MADEDILAWAASEERILITMDKDFSELTAFKRKEHSGIIRLENLPREKRRRHLEEILKLHGEDLQNRAIIIQKGTRIRIIR